MRTDETNTSEVGCSQKSRWRFGVTDKLSLVVRDERRRDLVRSAKVNFSQRLRRLDSETHPGGK